MKSRVSSSKKIKPAHNLKIVRKEKKIISSSYLSSFELRLLCGYYAKYVEFSLNWNVYTSL